MRSGRAKRALLRAASVDDLRQLACRRLPRECVDWLEGGANAETTLRANREAFERVTLRPRQLVDVSRRDQSTVVCGTPVASPILLAPVGQAGILRPRGEALAARAAGRFGTVFCLSSGSSVSLEEVARVAGGPLWFQAYLWRGQQLYEELARRAAASGYEALVVTVDTPVSARRERDVRNGFTLPVRFSPARWISNAGRHPGWTLDFARNPRTTFANLDSGAGAGAGAPVAQVMERLHDPSVTDEHLRGLRAIWNGKLLVKGILTAEDARRVVACGADGVIVSNHGGRQLDRAPATLDVVGEVAAAVGGDAAVLLDGGVRRGSDIATALALGADAVLIGRPYLYGLAVDGEEGVVRVLELLRDELDICLALLGRPTLRDLDSTVIGRRA